MGAHPEQPLTRTAARRMRRHRQPGELAGPRPAAGALRPRGGKAEAIVLSVYCPDRLADIQDRIDDLDLRDTARR
ncbi:hypothetical protein ACPC54_13135 [Kitasatospora sp. NPDC094028]